MDKRLDDLFDAWYSANVDDLRDVYQEINRAAGIVESLSKETGLSFYEVLDRLNLRYREYYKKRLREDLKRGRSI